MKYKFLPQTCLLVGGLAATLYADCWYQQTATLTYCFYSGAAVDTLSWHGSGGSSTVYATSSWNQWEQNGVKGYLNSVVYYFGTNPRDNYDYQPPTYCYGPAKFTDPAGNTDSVPYWENGAAYGYSIPDPPLNGLEWGVPQGNSCQ